MLASKENPTQNRHILRWTFGAAAQLRKSRKGAKFSEVLILAEITVKDFGNFTRNCF
jgi:hypothetical protein